MARFAWWLGLACTLAGVGLSACYALPLISNEPDLPLRGERLAGAGIGLVVGLPGWVVLLGLFARSASVPRPMLVAGAALVAAHAAVYVAALVRVG